jgi:hypothetical protein
MSDGCNSSTIQNPATQGFVEGEFKQGLIKCDPPLSDEHKAQLQIHEAMSMEYVLERKEDMEGRTLV